MYNFVLRNGVIIDGTGAPRFRGDIAIEGDRIAAVARTSSAGTSDLQGLEEIDLKGLCVAPGFIDMHSHADRSMLSNPQCLSLLSQGITTVVAGHCGGSQAPMNDRVRGWLAERARLSGAEHFRSPDWDTLDQFFERVKQARVGVNLAMVIGQGTVRNCVMGHEDRTPTTDEMFEMKRLVRQAMEQGAFGLSAGRTYMPGRLATAHEVAEMVREVVPFNGLYACHMKSEGDAILDGIDEVSEIARDTGCRPHIVHCKVVGKQNWGRAPEVLRAIEQMRESGIDVLFDVYPYNFAQVSTLKGLLSGLMPRVGIADILTSLRRDPAALLPEAERMALHAPAHVQNLASRGVVWCQHTKEHESKSIGEIADELGLDIVKTVVWLAVENHLGVRLAHIMDESEVRMIIRHPFSMMGTDASAHDVTGEKSLALHPRAFGAFARVLGTYVRQEQVLALEDAVRKMTSAAADRVGLCRRGKICAGFSADITVFNQHLVCDEASASLPTALSVGIEYVFVNGGLAFRNHQPTDLRNGQILRRRCP